MDLEGYTFIENDVISSKVGIAANNSVPILIGIMCFISNPMNSLCVSINAAGMYRSNVHRDEGDPVYQHHFT